MSISYTPSKTLEPFLTCDAFVSLISGPVGSGKSSAAMLKIAYHAAKMRRGEDGKRRSRAVIVRNTNQMLSDATIPTFMTWFPEGPAGSFARTDKRFYLRFDDVECEVLFRGLDDANDVRRLLSLECSFGILDEYREIHPDIFNALQGRVGRYPSVANGGCVDDSGELKPLANASYPITIGLDFGRTPAAVFMQRDPRGRVLVLSEVTSENMGIETFITTKLNPHIAQHYQGFQFVVAPDPAGFMKQQLNEMTLVDALKEAGFKCVKPPTNDPTKRIAAVERLLSQQVEGKAMFLVDPRCTYLIRGFRSGYRYKVKRNGELEDKPDKNDSSHVHDALQYGSAVIDMNIRGFGLANNERREVKRTKYAYT